MSAGRLGGAAACALALAVSACQVSAPTDSPAADSLPSASPSQPQNESVEDAPVGDADGPVVVDTVFAAGISGVTEPAREVIRTAEAWESAWARITSSLAPAPEAPTIDFASQQVVVLALGQRPSGGYGIEVAGVERADGVLEILVVEVAPGGACVTTQALTQPVLAIALAAGSEPVEFTEETVIHDCL